MVQGDMRPRSADVLVILACLGLAAPGTGAAQLGETFALEERQGALARVPDGEIIRVRLGSGARAAGPIRFWSTSSVTLGPYLGYAAHDTVLALAAIDTLWLRGRATRRGALWGGATGLAVGAVLGATTSSICPIGGRNQPCARGAVTSAVVGLVVGGLAGALVGSGNPQWRRLHPRDGRTAAPRGPAVILAAPGDTGAADPRALALARVRQGALVRLQFADGPDLAGYVERAGFRRAVLTPVGAAPAQGPVSLASLEAVWERGSARRTGAIVGAFVGAGAATWKTVDADRCPPDNGCAATILTNGVLGGLAGWVLGDRAGTLFPRWHRRF